MTEAATQDDQAGSRRAFTIPVIIYVLLLLGGTVAFIPAGLRAVAEAPLEAVLWTVFIAAANLLTIPMLPRMQVDASLGAPVSVAAAVLLHPAAALLVNFLGFTNEREIRRQASLWAVLFNRSQLAIAGGLAALAAQDLGIVAGTVVAVVVFNITNTLAVAVFVWLRRGVRLGSAAKKSSNPFPRFFMDWILVALLAVLIVVVYEGAGGWGAVLLALPMWLGYNALSSARESEDRAEQLAARVRDLEVLNDLGARLLAVRRPADAAGETQAALRASLGDDQVLVSLDGDLPDPLESVKIPGAEPAAIGVPVDLTDESVAVVEAIAGLLGMAVQRLELEQELTDVERARVALSGEILEEGTRERSRIALEIHDDVLPFLAAAEIQADNVRSALHGEDRTRADELAAATRQAVHDGIARLREVLEALRRQIVVPGGLRPGLVASLERLRLETGIAIHLDAPAQLPSLPLAVEILVLETVRGCLVNVARHAQASKVSVAVRGAHTLLEVEVRDDGRGFDPAAIPAGHHGLVLMAQRVELARGRFVVTSGPGAGTTVHLEVPL